MGNKGAKAGAKPISKKPVKLGSKDYAFLVKQTGLTKVQIDDIFSKFNMNNADA